MKKSIYVILWTVSIVLLAAILCSSAFMFVNGGGVGLDTEEDEPDDETTKKHISTREPIETTEQPLETDEIPTGTTKPNGTYEVTVSPLPPDIPSDTGDESQNLDLQLNESGTEYTVVGIGECEDSFIVIPAEYEGIPITTIGYQAFMHNAKIEGVCIPESVKTIDKAAFWGCVNLKTLELSEGILTIGASAFQECVALENFVIPSTVTNIGSTVFKGCLSLMSVSIPEGVTKLQNGLFTSCTNLYEINLPSTLTYICKRAFADCSNLEAINFNGTVDYVGEHATWWGRVFLETDWDVGTGDYTVYCIDGTIK